jgi:hypothetical protein
MIMRFIFRSLAFVFGLGIVASSFAGSVHATTLSTYEFTGPLFTATQDLDPPAGSYTTSMRVTGSFTAPTLPANIGLVDILGSIVDFSFTDGRRTMGPGDISSVYSFFRVATDAAGEISSWWIALETDFPLYVYNLGDQQNRIILRTTANIYTGYTEGDIYECTQLGVPPGTSYCHTVQQDYGYSSYPGRWAAPVTTSATPLPASISLLTTALGGLGFIGWLRKRTRRRAA